jgi:glucose-1-phosphate adenylyltransferase
MNDRAATVDDPTQQIAPGGGRGLPCGETGESHDRRAQPAPMNGTLAFVLAGGKGTRLGALTARRPKPAVPIGGKYRIIDFVLSNCMNSRIPQVAVLTQYLSESLAAYLSAWSARAARSGSAIRNLEASRSHPYRGTADAVHQNRDVVRSIRPSHVLVLAADHVYRMDYTEMLADHQRSGADVTIGCIEVPIGEAGEFGILEVDGRERVRDFVEKPRTPRAMPDRPDRALASMGIYLFDTDFLLNILAQDESDPSSTHDFGKDVIPRAVAAAHVQAHRLRDTVRPGRPAYWRDVGTIDAYWRTSLEMNEAGTGPDFDDPRWPISSALESDADGAAAFGASGSGNVIFPGAHIARGAIVEDSVILPGARIGQDCVIRKAIIDEGCTLPAGTRIGVDPDDDRAHFEVSPYGVVLADPTRLHL